MLSSASAWPFLLSSKTLEMLSPVVDGAHLLESLTDQLNPEPNYGMSLVQMKKQLLLMQKHQHFQLLDFVAVFVFHFQFQQHGQHLRDLDLLVLD
jgi:hypothetical protein